MEKQTQYTPIRRVGLLSFRNDGGVDVGGLESSNDAVGAIKGIKVRKTLYEAYYSVREDGLGIGALIVASEDFRGETLTASEKLGEIIVPLSGIVGFFCSPKKAYTAKQMDKYLKELEHDYHASGTFWKVLNSRQFICPSGQPIGSVVPVFCHRNKQGQIDAIQMEFSRKAKTIAELAGEGE